MVTTNNDRAGDQSWSSESAFQPTEVPFTAPDPDGHAREAALGRASRSRSDAAATALRLRAASEAAATTKAVAEAAQAAAEQAQDAAAKAAAGKAERRADAAAHQAEHDRADRAAQDQPEQVQAVSTRASTRQAASLGTSAPPAAETSSGSSSSAGRGALAEAPNHAGKPYEWGATGPSSFDCSGFTSYLFARQGTQLPRTSSDQYAASTKVSKSAKQPGDLIFTYSDGGIYHVGIYAGGSMMWAATKSGDVVRKQEIWSSQHYVGRFS